MHAHNDIVRAALTSHGGHEVKHTGDGIFASFPAASNGLDCAQAIQQAVTDLANPDLGVKIGLNAGEPIAEEDDLAESPQPRTLLSATTVGTTTSS